MKQIRTNRHHDSQSGMALLLELLVVMLVLAILGTMAVPSFVQMNKDRAQQAAVARVHQLVNLQLAYQICVANMTGQGAAIVTATCGPLAQEIPSQNSPTVADSGGYIFEYHYVAAVPGQTIGGAPMECVIEWGPSAQQPYGDAGNYLPTQACYVLQQQGLIPTVPVSGAPGVFANLGTCQPNYGPFPSQATGDTFEGFACQTTPVTIPGTLPGWMMLATPVNDSPANNGVAVSGSMLNVLTCTPVAGAPYTC